MNHSLSPDPIMRQAQVDRCMIQEIINDLVRHGYSNGSKADELLKDWSRELREKSGLRGRTRKFFHRHVGRYLY